jgi:hypothetical protein
MAHSMVRSLLLAALAASESNALSLTPLLGHRSVKPSNFRPATNLRYAALEDPMSKADSTKSGCPFLIQKYEFRTFDVPVLFGAGEFMNKLRWDDIHTHTHADSLISQQQTADPSSSTIKTAQSHHEY